MADSDGSKPDKALLFYMQKMEFELRCPLCLNFLKSATLLPCDHVFCRSCIPNSGDVKSRCCPVCLSSYVDSALMTSPHTECMLIIYKSLNAVINKCFYYHPHGDSQGGQSKANQKRKSNVSVGVQHPPCSSSFAENKSYKDDGNDIAGEHVLCNCKFHSKNVDLKISW